MSRETEGFLNRWSTRKQAARVDEVAPDSDPEALAPAETPEEPEKSDVEILEELGLKDPDEMAPGDDFSGFMASGIPDRLRNRALRKLWLTNPVLANLDELIDYGEDFTDAATVVENLQTAYRVGKGFLRQEEIDAENDAENDASEPLEAETNAEAESEVEVEGEAEQGQEQETEQAATDTDEPASEDPDSELDSNASKPLELEAEDARADYELARTEAPEDETVPPRLRRMVFRVENS